MQSTLSISPDVLRIDASAEIERITASIREAVGQQLRCKGAVVGASGGIDSSVVVFSSAPVPSARNVYCFYSHPKRIRHRIACISGAWSRTNWAQNRAWKILLPYFTRLAATNAVTPQSAG